MRIAYLSGFSQAKRRQSGIGGAVCNAHKNDRETPPEKNPGNSTEALK